MNAVTHCTRHELKPGQRPVQEKSGSIWWSILELFYASIVAGACGFPKLLILGLCFMWFSGSSLQAAEDVRLVTLDPGHFHAALVQKFMYPQVSSVVQVYGPPGQDLRDHLKRIEGFNTRHVNPTKWEQHVYTGTDFLERMTRDRAGNVVVLAG